jgi:t-SNARE complex subunit (syntaxin)
MEVSDMVECVAAQEGEKRYKEEFEKAEAALERALDAVEAEKKKTKFFSDIVLVCIIADVVLPIVGFLIGRATR